MRSLSNFTTTSIIFCLCLTGCATTTKTPTTSTIETSKYVFGYPFIVHNNWGKNNFYEYVDPIETIFLRTFAVKSNETAHAFVENQMSLFRSVFDPKRVSYPGQYSRAIECPEKFKPQYMERNQPNGLLYYFLGFANNNKAPGACSDDLISYRHLYGLIYCESQKIVVEINYFSAIDSNLYTRFLRNVSCDNEVTNF